MQRLVSSLSRPLAPTGLGSREAWEVPGAQNGAHSSWRQPWAVGPEGKSSAQNACCGLALRFTPSHPKRTQQGRRFSRNTPAAGAAHAGQGRSRLEHRLQRSAGGRGRAPPQRVCALLGNLIIGTLPEAIPANTDWAAVLRPQADLLTAWGCLLGGRLAAPSPQPATLGCPLGLAVSTESPVLCSKPRGQEPPAAGLQTAPPPPLISPSFIPSFQNGRHSGSMPGLNEQVGG